MNNSISSTPEMDDTLDYEQSHKHLIDFHCDLFTRELKDEEVIESFKSLLRQKVNFHIRLQNDSYILIEIVQSQRCALLDFALKHIRNVDDLDSESQSAIYYAALTGNELLVQTLLKACPNLNLKNQNNVTMHELISRSQFPNKAMILDILEFYQLEQMDHDWSLRSASQTQRIDKACKTLERVIGDNRVLFRWDDFNDTLVFLFNCIVNEPKSISDLKYQVHCRLRQLYFVEFNAIHSEKFRLLIFEVTSSLLKHVLDEKFPHKGYQTNRLLFVLRLATPLKINEDEPCNHICIIDLVVIQSIIEQIEKLIQQFDSLSFLQIENMFFIFYSLNRIVSFWAEYSFLAKHKVTIQSWTNFQRHFEFIVKKVHHLMMFNLIQHPAFGYMLMETHEQMQLLHRKLYL